MERRGEEKLVRRVAEAKLPTEYGEFRLFVYESLVLRDLEDLLTRGRLPAMRILCSRTKVPEEYGYWAIPDATGSCEEAPPPPPDGP